MGKEKSGKALSDMEWQALCYVFDELSDAQREAFEQEMADSQAAREALAAAVELQQLVAQAEACRTITRVPATRLAWQTTVKRATIALAAGLLLALLLRFSEPLPWNRVFADSSFSTRQLADAWLQTREVTRALPLSPDSPDIDISSEDGSDPADSPIAPDWLLVAVQDMNAGADGAQPAEPREAPANDAGDVQNWNEVQ